MTGRRTSVGAVGVRALLAVVLALLVAPQVAAAAAGPATGVTVTVGSTSSGGVFPADVAWTAPAGADPAQTSYDVQLVVDGVASAPARVATTTWHAPSVPPAASVTATVVTLDAATATSSAPASAPTVVAPKLVPALGAPMVSQGGRALTCGATVARACTVRSLAGLRLTLDIADASGLERVPTRLVRQYRAPGTRALRPVYVLAYAPARARTTAALTGRHLSRSGTWCLRVRLLGSRTTVEATSAARCVRYRPPVSIAWAGDTTLGSHAYGLPGRTGRSVLASVRGTLSAADLAIGNYEGTLSTGGSPRCSGGPLCFIFQAPPRMADAIRWAGFDVMNVANNHGLDMGLAARGQTVAALRAQGLGVAGLPGTAVYRQVEDTRVAILGFSHSHANDHIRDRAAAVRLVRAASRRADVVVVVMHAGAEGAAAAHVPYGDENGFGENRGNTRAFVHAVIDAGADVVFGSGPHVVRGIEQRAGRLAFYSTGNFAGWHNFALGGLGSQSGIAEVTLDERGEFTAGTWHSIRLDRPGIPRPDASGSSVDRVRTLSRQDFGSASPIIRRRTGAITLRHG